MKLRSALATTLFGLMAGIAVGQHATPLRSVVFDGLTAASAPIDNRSTLIRHSTAHTFCATGSGTWSVQIQYSDVSSSGPWTSFTNPGSSVNQASTTCVGIGIGYHAYIRFSFTGSSSADYAGTANLFLGSSGGGGGSSGTVTDIGVTVPSWLSVSPSSINSSGVFAITVAAGQTQNRFLASPNGSSGPIGIRSIVGADLPAINLAATGAGGVTGNLPITNLCGGIGASGATFLRGDCQWASPVGSGDFSSNTSFSVIGEILVFADAGGKLGKRSTGNGIAKLISGVLGTAVGGTDYELPLTFSLPLSRSTNTLSCPTCSTNAAANTLYAILLGGGGQSITPMASPGSITTVLHGNASGPPTFSQIDNTDISNNTIDLTSKVTGILPSLRGGTGSAYVTFLGPTAPRNYTLPDAPANIMTNLNSEIVKTNQSNTYTTGRQDMSGAASTAPMKVGPSLPGTCVVGDLYFKNDATAGQNQYNCTATNTWTQNLNSGGGGGVSNIALLDCGVTRTSATVLTLFSGASSTNLCVFGGNGGSTYTVTASETITISSGTPTVRVYVSDGSDGNTAGARIVCASGSSGIAVSGGLTLVTSCSAFPVSEGIYKHSSWTATVSTTWDATGTLLRSLMSSGTRIKVGAGLALTKDGTGTTVAYDTTSVYNIRTCDIAIGDTSGSALTNAQLGPQGRICFLPFAATVLEILVEADGGTPSVIVGRNTAGTQVNFLSAALATAASGGIACSKTTAVTSINGVTTCSATLQNTSIAAGAYIELVSGTAGGTAKFFKAHIVYTVN